MWDLARPDAPLPVVNLKEPISRSVAFLDTDHVLSGINDALVHVWSLSKRQVERKFLGHTGNIISVDVSPDRAWAATRSRDGTAKLWPLAQASGLQEVARVPGNYLQICLSPNNDEVLFATESPPRAYALQVATGTLHQGFLPPPKSSDYYMGFSQDGNQVYLANQSFGIYDRRSGSLEWEIEDPKGAVLDFLCSPDASTAILCKQNHLEAIDLRARHTKWQRSFDNSIINKVFSVDSSYLYVGNQIGQVHELNMSDGSTSRVLPGRQEAIAGLATSPNGVYLAFSARDRTNGLLNLLTGKVERHFAATHKTAHNLRFTADGRSLVGIVDAKEIVVWHVPTGQLVLQIAPLPEETPARWAISANGHQAWCVVESDGHVSVQRMDLFP